MACNICSKDIRIHEGMMTIHATCLNAIRADERAKIVAMLEAMAKEKFTEPASNDLLRAAKRVLSGEHRPKPGQPKEGGQ